MERNTLVTKKGSFSGFHHRFKDKKTAAADALLLGK